MSFIFCLFFFNKKGYAYFIFCLILDTEVEEKKPKKKKDKDKERDRSRGRKRSRSRSAEKRRRSRSGSGDRVMIKQVMPPAAIDVEYEEMKWALNMTLIGDMHWKSLTSVDDIKSIVLRMDRKVNFKVNRLNTYSGKKIKELIFLFFTERIKSQQ